jgi:hypothetical protein
MREDLKDAYKTLSDYDRHYSTVRATGVIFLFGLSFGIGSFLLTSASSLLKDPYIVLIVSMIPLLSLVAAFVLSCHFQQLTAACQMYMRAIEKTSGTPTVSSASPLNITGLITRRSPGQFNVTGAVSVPASTATGLASASQAGGDTVPRFDECGRNLKALIEGDRNNINGDLIERLTDARTGQVKLPRFLFFDLPNQIITVAFSLLLYLPCLALALYQGSKIELLGLLLEGLVVLLVAAAVWINGKYLKEWWFRNVIVIVVGLVFIGALVLTRVFCFPNPPPPVNVLTPTGCDYGFKRIDPSVESFLPGAHDSSKAETSTKLFRDLMVKIDEIKEDAEQGCPLPMAMFVVGSTDRRNLKEKLDLTYGGNTGLARGRAEPIAEEIRKRLPGDVKVLSLITGSLWHGLEDDPKKEEEMARDRSVTVYGLWAVKQMEDSRASKINN